ncbi:MAG: hypothetical protein J0L78_07550 [Planctomycetes bacterium]|nr:hypothetical protein [Planctomycetota bacterium]
MSKLICPGCNYELNSVVPPNDDVIVCPECGVRVTIEDLYRRMFVSSSSDRGVWASYVIGVCIATSSLFIGTRGVQYDSEYWLNRTLPICLAIGVFVYAAGSTFFLLAERRRMENAPLGFDRIVGRFCVRFLLALVTVPAGMAVLWLVVSLGKHLF